MEANRFALEERMLCQAREQGLFRAGQTALVAVSGGMDSMALLHGMRSLGEALGLSVCAAHFEHGIRGEASAQDALFVAAHCERLGVPCQIGHGDVPALAKKERISLEDAARRARYAFLEAAAEAAHADWIVLGHQLEDQAETLLLHLVHGAGLKGISAMEVVSGRRIRPFLHTPRAELEAYVREAEIPFREDDTNADTRYARNFLRHEVFPLLKRLNPRVAEAMARTALVARQAETALMARARMDIRGRMKRMPYGAFLFLEGMALSPETARAFCSWAEVPPLDARQTGLLAARSPCNLPGGWRALFTRERLHLLSGATPEGILAERDFAFTPCEKDETCDGLRSQTFDADQLVGASFRFRRAGDVFAPLNGPGSQKLKQALRDAGIDQPFREYVPVLARGNRVLWIVGVKPAREADCREARQTVRIDYRGDLPWEIA